jgi:Carboxypeptidase regulatory-like domain
MKGRGFQLAVALLATCLLATSAFAQGGGASSTGTINGKVTDASQAVLPGVTVTATSPALLGPQVSVTNAEGSYRFPGVPPGTYTVTFELPGFSTVKNEGIEIRLGFTATLNVEMKVASLQETVTVTGASPVIDTSTTRTQQNFKIEQLQSLPNARDMWALLAVTPSVMVARVDVGGNRAGTQSGYTAYGFTGQVRVLIEGINTTEGTGGAGFYFDYASLEEAFLGTTGQTAEMPNPGVQSQFIAKSGGNNFVGEYHLDWYNNSLQGKNLPASYLAPTAFNGTNGSNAIRDGANEILDYYDHDINAGGPIKKDKVWYFGTARAQQNKVAQPNFQFDKTFDTKLWNMVGKGTYQLNQKNKLIGYYQWGQKIQPNRLPFATYTYKSPEQTFKQNSGSWVYKGEWNSTVNDKLYIEARYGDFGYYFPLVTNSPDNFFWHDTGALISEGAHQAQQLDRDRAQYTAAATYFLDSTKGSHTIKMGGELLQEKSWEGFTSRRGGTSNIEQVYANGVSSQVIFGIPTARSVNSLSAHDDLLSKAALDAIGFFVNDTWATGRSTINLGLRYDRYHGWLPEQEVLGATVGPVTVAGKNQPETALYTMSNLWAPRLGYVYDLSGNGKTVVKANYGFYWHNPGVGISQNANPNIASKSATYTWNDQASCAGCINGDKRWQPGEQSANPTAQALSGAIKLDPDIRAPYSHEASVWIERQISQTMGARVGFVYKTEDDLITNNYQKDRPISVYTQPFTFVDLGLDGVRGTADDRNLTMFGIPGSVAAGLSTDQYVMNLPEFGRYKTIEVSTNKRYGNKWSASMGGGFTWLQNYPDNYPQTPNKYPDFQNGESRTTWQFKASGTYDAPYEIRISPIFRHQSGVNFAREATITAPTGSGLVVSGGGPNATRIHVEPANANREDNIWVFDTRVERQFKFHQNLQVRGFVDFFNITNSHASETIGRATGLSYLKPALILAPRTMRLGFRVIF